MVDDGLIIEERDTNLDIQGFYFDLDENNFIIGYSSSRMDNAPFAPTESFPNQDENTNFYLYRYVGGQFIFDESRIVQEKLEREQEEEVKRIAEIEKELAVDKLKNQIKDLQLELEQKNMDIFNTQIALADVYELLMGGL